MNFFGFGSASDFQNVFDGFFKIEQPFFDNNANCPTLVEFSHVLDELLLLGSPRKLNGGVPITGLWPGMAEDLWQRYLDYTNSNPDAIDTKIFLEFHNSKRVRPVGIPAIFSKFLL